MGMSGEEQSAEAAAHDAADTSLTLARESYRAGQSSVLQVLDAQRQYQQARLGLVHSQSQVLIDTIAVLVATGSDDGSSP